MKIAQYPNSSLPIQLNQRFQSEKIDRLKELADINIAAVIVIANLTNDEAIKKGWGPQMIEQKYGAKVYSVITATDVMNVIGG